MEKSTVSDIGFYGRKEVYDQTDNFSLIAFCWRNDADVADNTIIHFPTESGERCH
jgi:hypothetical protein